MQNASEIQGLTASMIPSQRMLDLQRQYYALGAQAAPAMPEQPILERKLLRQLQAPAASAGVRY